MGKIKIKRPLADSKRSGGYMARTIGKGYLSSIPVSAWTQSYHKPYQCDWGEAKQKAVEHCKSSAIIFEGGITNGSENTR